MNFIDARTQWIDEGFKRALEDGIKQARRSQPPSPPHTQTPLRLHCAARAPPPRARARLRADPLRAHSHTLPPPPQVVIIAAGFDTRAYRLGRPGVKFFEVDLPHASEKKRELVEKLFPADKVRSSRRTAIVAVRWHAPPTAPARCAPPHPPSRNTHTHPVQYPRPTFIGADLSKVCLKEALAGSGFSPRVRTLYLIEVCWVCVGGQGS